MSQNNDALDLDEIDLLDYVRIIKRRKKTVLSLVVLSAAISVVLVIRSPKIYEAQAAIKIGSVANPLIPAPEAVILAHTAKIFSSACLKLDGFAIGRLKEMSDAGDIASRILESVNFIKLSVKNRDPVLAAKITNAIADSLVIEGHKNYGQKKLVLERQIMEQQNQIDDILSRLDERRSGFSPNAVEVKRFNTYKDIYLAVDAKISALKDQLSNFSDFEVVESAIIPEHPIKTNVVQKAIVVFFSVLISGLFIISINKGR